MRNKSNTKRFEKNANKSLHSLYRELLDLRDEVKEAEQRSSQRRPNEKPFRKVTRPIR